MSVTQICLAKHFTETLEGLFVVFKCCAWLCLAAIDEEKIYKETLFLEKNFLKKMKGKQSLTQYFRYFRLRFRSFRYINDHNFVSKSRPKKAAYSHLLFYLRYRYIPKGIKQPDLSYKKAVIIQAVADCQSSQCMALYGRNLLGWRNNIWL